MYNLALPTTPHRFAPFFQDMPILQDGQPLQLDEHQRQRAGHFLELCGFGKVRESTLKRWPPPRGKHMLGNAGFWVPVDTPDPLELKLPHPEDLTPDERQEYRTWLDQFDD